MGTPGGHTYMVGQTNGRTVLDAARAALRLSGAGLSTNAPVGIVGYSQGGQSAGWAAQLASTYAPELKIKGVVAGGVPADLTKVAEFLDGSAFVSFALMAAMGLDRAYGELDLETFLNDKGTKLQADNANTCLLGLDGFGALAGTAFTSMDDWVTSNPLYTPAWQNRLNQNRLGASKPSVPVYQYHAEFDEIVPLDPALQLRSEWCAKGANVRYEKVSLSEHATGLVAGYPGALTWLTERFLGLPAIGNCGL
jgi:pimeloyl-ACP methyl ester carboxylesterase